MKINSVKDLLVYFLREKRTWMFGGVLEELVRKTLRTKGCITSRRLRELREDGVIKRRLIQVKPGQPKVVQYKV